MEALNAKAVSRKYGQQVVLAGLDLKLEAGAFEALMGPSGCGKSTFLHIAAGLLNADEGAVEIGGEAITALGDAAATRFRRRHVGVVFQSFNLLNEKTVRENILLPLRLDGRAIDGDATERLQSLAETLGLTDKLAKRPEELSGGEQQRVAIARALVAEPEILLADEPTGNLDAKASKTICGLLKRLNETEKSAILVVTHDPVVAATAQRVHFLQEGKIARTFETNQDPALVSKNYLETYQ